METTLNINLGKRIRELRLAKKLKQGQVADMLDMERSNFTRIESGKQAPNDKNLIKIAEILNVSVKDLFDFEHLKPKSELIELINKQLCDMTDKEIQYCYKSILILKQMR